jgi:plasmid stabilization system protein ParE
MAYKLVVTAKAQNDLDLIDRYSLEQFGRTVGTEYMDGFLAVFDRLKAYPESGPLYPECRRPFVVSLTEAISCFTTSTVRSS